MAGQARTRTTGDLVLAGIAVLVVVILYVAFAGRTSDATTLAFLGRFHPLAVHLPIGMVLLVGALEGLAIFPRLRERTDPALGIILRLALATAIAAFALGLMLASGGGHPERLLQLHRRLTAAFVLGSAASLVLWSLHQQGRAPRLAHRASLGLTLALLGAGAHFGGSMTHGESYLVEYGPSFLRPAPPPAPAPSTSAATAEEPRVLDDVVLPVLKQRCAGCHGLTSAKGQLRVDSLEAMMKGGKSGPAVVAGDAKRSLLMQRIAKPITDDEHMPPEGKPQPTADEIELVALWIDRGASPTIEVRELLVPDGARRLLMQARGAPTTTAPAPVTPEPSASATTNAAAVPKTEPPRAAAASEEPVLGVFATKCGQCHGATKQKGKLRVDSLAALSAGGKSGPALGARGTIVERLRLPLDDERHMPPREEPQLDAGELARLTGWLSRSAAPSLPRPEERPASTPKPTSPAPTAATPAPASTAPDHPVRLHTAVVLPVLQEKCGRCHSAERPSAGVVVTDRDGLVTNGHVVPGRPDTSPLLQRMTLPIDDDDHMPPRKAAQPSAAEIAAVRLWIERGATADVVVDASEVPSALLATPAPPTTAKTEGPAPTTPSPRPEVAPVRGGCAGCAMRSGDSPGSLVLAAAPMLFAWMFVRRRRR